MSHCLNLCRANDLVIAGVRAVSLSFSLAVFLVVLLPAQDPATRKEGLLRAAESPKNAVVLQSPALNSGPLRLIDISLDILAAAGSSTAHDSVLGNLQGGGHDPRKRGFTLQQAELKLSGAVDSWCNAEASLVASIDPESGETVVELEEAFGTTQSLPEGLQVKAGMYLTEFGRINQTHPHAWDWMDQPLINTRVFGPDGMRAPGARVSWLLPTYNYTELIAGVQNANGETMSSFLANEEFYAERPIGGRPFIDSEVQSMGDLAWSARLSTSFDFNETSTVLLGTSVVFGPNASGEGAATTIYGADFTYKWKPLANTRGWPFVKVQSEFVVRDFDASTSLDVDQTTLIPSDTLNDYGGYLQCLCGFSPGWDLGLRGEWVTGSGQSYQLGQVAVPGGSPAVPGSFVSRETDFFRGNRIRISPLLQYHPSEFSRLRLQYNFDNVANELEGVGDNVHSVWIGVEFLIGVHPPHNF